MKAAKKTGGARRAVRPKSAASKKSKTSASSHDGLSLLDQGAVVESQPAEIGQTQFRRFLARRFFKLRPGSLSTSTSADGAFECGTTIGNLRSRNEDRCVVICGADKTRREPFVLAMVADGVGGLADGDRCAALTLAEMSTAIVFANNQSASLATLLEEIIIQANAKIFNEFGGNSGTTVAVFCQRGEQRVIGWLGDSRISALSGSEMWHLSVDDRARMSGRSEITAFIGMSPSCSPHVKAFGPREQRVDRLLIATDGLSAIHPSSLLGAINNRTRPESSAAERLLSLANTVDGQDNSTIVLLNLSRIDAAVRGRTDMLGTQILLPDAEIELFEPGQHAFPQFDDVQREKRKGLRPLVAGKDKWM